MSRSSPPVVGVLALQGDVVEHLLALERCGARAFAVKTQDDLDAVDALIVPGGESTTVMRLLDRSQMAEPIASRVRAGMPFWGTCMGMIVASHDIVGRPQPTLDLIDITVRRNAFGRQSESAETALEIPALGTPRFPAIFIRAPWIERTGPDVEVLAEVEGHPVFVQAGCVMATSFHPELTNDDRVHRHFLSLAERAPERESGRPPQAA
jgi:pyridoxal 5'-phosphate synthase pdxT subunit